MGWEKEIKGEGDGNWKVAWDKVSGSESSAGKWAADNCYSSDV